MTSTHSDMDWAVKVAKAELERDALKEQRDSAWQAFRDLQAGQNFHMFGQPPEYWLNLQAALRRIAAEDYRGNRPASATLAERALRWKAEDRG